MFELYGLVIYEILDNGNLLSGVYTNNQRREHLQVIEVFGIESEIARRRERSAQGVGGVYDARYIIARDEEGGNAVYNRRLKVVADDEVFRFTWLMDNNDDTIEFEGMGMMVGQNHIAVSYVEPRNQS